MRILTIGHSYVVRQNRSLARAIADAGGGNVELTCAAPETYPGDLRVIACEAAAPGEPELITIPVVGGRSQGAHTLWYSKLKKRLPATRWDLVHVWEEPFTLPGWQIARAFADHCPVVISTFQNIVKRYPPPFNYFDRDTLGRSAAWIALSQSVHDCLRQREYYRRRPSRILPMGTDADHFCPSPERRRTKRAQLCWEESDPVVGYLGRFVEEKGINVLLAALESVQGPWRALFVGGGPMEERLRRWGQNWPGRVVVQTGVVHDEVPGFLNAMDILCAPSLTTAHWREQFGRMLIEAMACGVAVIGSDSGEIPNVLAGAGRVVHEGDAAALATAIEELLDKPEERARLALLGRRAVEEKYSWTRVGQRNLEFFRQLGGGE